MSRSLRKQQGVVMWVAVIVLIIMALSGLAMLRQTGAGVSIAGNVAFKQNATSTADAGTEAGIRRILDLNSLNPAALLSDNQPNGYYATWGANNEPATFDWDNHSVAVNLDAGTGNDVRFIVHRLCRQDGPVEAITQVCSDAQTDYGKSKSSFLGSYNPGAPDSVTIKPFYRVTTRVTGPRSTVSYIQVIVE